MNNNLSFLVDSVARRYRFLQWAWVLTIAWCVLAAVWIIGASTSEFSRLLSWQQAIVGITVVTVTLSGTWLLSKRRYQDRRWVASQIEAAFPSLQERLITAIQLKQTDSFFEKSLVDDTIRHARTHDWSKVIPAGRVLLAWTCQFLSLTLAILVIARVWKGSDVASASSVTSLMGDAMLISPVVEPGDIECEQGSDVLVSVRFPGKVPAEAWLETSSESEKGSRESMSRSLKDPVFSTYLRGIPTDLTYRVDFLDGLTREFKITTFAYPALMRSDAKIESPEYANLEPKEIENTRRVTVVDGATLTWSCLVNKPVAIAELMDETGHVTTLVPNPENPLCYRASFMMTDSRRWKVRLVDQEQRECKFMEELSAKVLPNVEPEIKLARASDSRVSPLQEFQIRATVTDDFGIQKSGVVVTLGDAEPHDAEVQTLQQKPGKVEISYLVDLESMNAEADQLVNYYFWSEDIDRDGQPRRVEGEMFFAEVRPFEEVFREGPSMSEQQQQQQQQQQSQGEKKAEDLAELQKQIMSATWNVLRREKQSSISLSFGADVQTILDSQQEALEQTEDLKQTLQDEKSKEYLEKVRVAMTLSVEHLENTLSAADLEDLRQALRQERSAYETLLKLRAREHQIVKSQQKKSQSSQSASQRDRQEQLEQLQLEQDDNRYETEQQAETSEPSAQRENRQVMNRLEELARRQKDVNEQLKNLETELREAKTEEKKKELEEQLQRLRDNQEELLRDTDELLERMNEPENRQAMQEAREQTEQARGELQKSTQSLSQGETSQSLSSGTRAQRQLEETREQLRKESSNQFDQTMRQLLEQAEALEKQQQALSEQVQKPKGTSSNPKGSGANTESLAEAENATSDDDKNETASPLRPEGEPQPEKPGQPNWQSQKRDLNQILEKVRETVSEAESSEQLLSEQLYETFRETKQKAIEQRLDQIPILMERGLQEPANRMADEVKQGIQDLKAGIAEAAQGVLGSEEESLRRALGELQRAERQISQEANREGSTGDPIAGNPITGESYSSWSDSIRDVEELVRDPEMRAEAARIREAVRSMRVDHKRHAKEPEWPLVRQLIANPLQQLTEKVQEELLRLSAERNALIPVDRDPVPSLYQQRLDRYYENLGTGMNLQKREIKPE
jgi:hypothetical protein